MRGSRVKQAVDGRGKDFLTESEIKRFLDAARRTRHSVRDYLMMLMAYRQGLRVSELVDVRMRDLDLETGRLYVRRKKAASPRTVARTCKLISMVSLIRL